ncbi:MAG: WbuC family cupin fold metalloprotein [Bryobacterales bacterium]|jgi:cupin fold WbuC family metalloprotein|nr:WbuC family cupin fold metalloprotein [Bryobacterales bacterium]
MRDREVVELIGGSHFLALEERAQLSARRRAVQCFHTGDGDNPHRFLNLLLQGTYVAPHRHATPPKAESFVVLRGELGVLLFADDGTVTGVHRLRAWEETGEAPRVETPPCGLDLLPGIWHSIVALSPVTVIFEVKPGPYDAATDKAFAEWAPAEGEPGVGAYLQWMEAQFAEDHPR